jgi:hypothetical protein
MTYNYEEILKNLELYNPVNKKIRVGHDLDGGYVIIDGYEYDCILSAGIADEVSFENDFIKQNPNIDAYAFDGTVERPEALSEKFTYVKSNIGVISSEDGSQVYSNGGLGNYVGGITNLKEYVKKYKNIFVKMDVEGEEWNWVRVFEDSLNKVKQLTIEVHALFPHLLSPHLVSAHCQNLPHDEWSDNILESLKILNKTHYLVHVHENNASPLVKIGDHEYPTFYELTYIRKDCKVDGLNKESLPLDGLDFPTFGPQGNDINFYPFKS